MKTVLCISPHFSPINAADFHRLRQSLYYFKDFNWRPVFFVVNPKYVEQSREELFSDALPPNIEIHRVNAFSAKWTRKFGLGNLGFRSWLQFRSAVDSYLKYNKVDLIYFSTTVFTLMSLGPHWKKKYGVPFIVDLQDPWRNDYYLSLDKKERPRKFWFDYRQKKYLEAFTMRKVSGIVSVSDGYIKSMKSRYPQLESKKCLTLPFGFLASDLEIAKRVSPAPLDSKMINVVYVGRGGGDMEFSILALFSAFKIGLEKNKKYFSNIRFSFFGTSYASAGRGEKSVMPIAEQCGICEYVDEFTDRLPYYKSLSTLLAADILFVPGSLDENYTASKIFPYIMTGKPLLAVFHFKSSVVEIMRSTQAGEVATFSKEQDLISLKNKVFELFNAMVKRLPYQGYINYEAFKPYSAREITRQQCLYFDEILN